MSGKLNGAQARAYKSAHSPIQRMLGNAIFGSLLSQIPPAPNQNGVCLNNSSVISSMPSSVTFSVMPQPQQQQQLMMQPAQQQQPQQSQASHLMQHPQQQQQQQHHLQQQHHMQQQQQMMYHAQNLSHGSGNQNVPTLHVNMMHNVGGNFQSPNNIVCSSASAAAVMPQLVTPNLDISIKHEMDNGGVGYAPPQQQQQQQQQQPSGGGVGTAAGQPPEEAARFVCSMCDKSFRYRHGLTQHQQEAHLDKKAFLCMHCDKSFTRRYQLERHQRTHSSSTQETHHCADCGEVFHMRESFLLHIRTHATHNNDANSNGQLALSQHLNSLNNNNNNNNNNNPFRCDACHLVFNNKTLLVKHRKKEHPGQSLGRLRRVNHNNSAAAGGLDMSSSGMAASGGGVQMQDGAGGMFMNHSGGMRSGTHLCMTCNKRFMNRYGLQRHLRTHTGERPHDCDVCGLSFMERSHMKQHRMTHTGETPYSCDICHRGFNRKFSYQRHIHWHTKGSTCSITGGSPVKIKKEKSCSSSDSITQLLNSVVAETTAAHAAAAAQKASSGSSTHQAVSNNGLLMSAANGPISSSSTISTTVCGDQKIVAASQQQQQQASMGNYPVASSVGGYMNNTGNSFTMQLNGLPGVTMVTAPFNNVMMSQAQYSRMN